MKQNKYIFSAPHMSRLPVIFALLIIGISALKQLHENTFARKPVEGKLMIYFMWLTIGYIAVLGNALEYGENNRFRVQTDPLIIIAFVIGSHRIWRQLAR